MAYVHGAARRACTSQDVAPASAALPSGGAATVCTAPRAAGATALQMALEHHEHLLRVELKGNPAASTAEGEVEFLCQVNTLVQSCFQCWQSVQLDQLATTSSLARLIPDVVARLSSSAQERTLAFFNDVVRTFQADRAAMCRHSREDTQEHRGVRRPRRPSCHALVEPSSRRSTRLLY